MSTTSIFRDQNITGVAVTEGKHPHNTRGGVTRGKMTCACRSLALHRTL